QKKRPAGYRSVVDGYEPSTEWIEVPDGRATLGVDRDEVPFGWDNEFPSRIGDVPGFAIERNNVTNARFLEFVEAGGYETDGWWRPEDWRWVQQSRLRHPLFWERDGGGWHWRGMFERIPLPLSWPMY